MSAAVQAHAATLVVWDAFAPFQFGSHTVALGAALAGRSAVGGKLVVDAYRFTNVITRRVVEAYEQQGTSFEEWVALYDEGFASPDLLSIDGAATNGSPPHYFVVYPNTGDYPILRGNCDWQGYGCGGQGYTIHERYAGMDVTIGAYAITLDLTPQALNEINTTGGLTFNYFGSSDYYGGSDISDAVVTLETGIPEPASWALMIAGFGGLGAALRRRRQAASIA
jgi:hypothetical protein